MTLHFSEESIIVGKHKPDLGGSGLCRDSARNLEGDMSKILAEPPNLCKGANGLSLSNQSFKAIPVSLVQSQTWEFAKLKYRAFITEILIRCVWKAQTYVSQGHVIELLPGQFAGSLRGILELFNPKGLRGKAKSDIFSKNDIEGAIQYFSNSKIIRQEIRHGITIITFIDKDICELNFYSNQTDNQTVIRQKSDSSLGKNDATHIGVPEYHEYQVVSKDTPARTDSRNRPRKVDLLKFSFESGTFEGITDQDRKNWQEAYQEIDVSVELAKAGVWVRSNPDRKKKNWARFLNGWFLKANDMAFNRRAYTNQNQKQEKREWKKKYQTTTTDCKVNSLANDLPERVSLLSLLEQTSPQKLPNG